MTGRFDLRNPWGTPVWCTRKALDALGGAAFHYVRVFLLDGEMAWSSPLRVDQ